MDQVVSPRRSIWRFSLRELLLLMLAAGAMIGWATVLYRSQRLKPTPFFVNNENWRNDVLLIFQELGEPPFKDVPGTMMHSESSSDVQRTFVFRIPLPPEKRGAFLSSLVAKIREKMKKEGCRNTGESGSSMNDNNVSVLGYSHGIVCGAVQICVMDAGNGEIAVTMTMQESQGMNYGFGLENGRFP